MTVATVSMKGQITLPAKAREIVGIRPHDRVVVEIRDEGIFVRPVSNFLKLKGFLGKGLPREKERERMAMGIAAHLRKRA